MFSSLTVKILENEKWQRAATTSSSIWQPVTGNKDGKQHSIGTQSALQ